MFIILNYLTFSNVNINNEHHPTNQVHISVKYFVSERLNIAMIHFYKFKYIHRAWVGMFGWAVGNSLRFVVGICDICGPPGIWLNGPEATWFWLNEPSCASNWFWRLLHDVTSPSGFMTCNETMDEDHCLSEFGMLKTLTRSSPPKN